MPRGGARVNSGPPPDPNALRRDRPSDAAGWTILPAEGRRKANGAAAGAPRWPLLPDIGLRAKLAVAEGQAEAIAQLIESYLLEERDTENLERRHERIAERIEVLRFQVAEQDDREKALWREIWAYPQALIWERDRQTRAVAMYVRHQVLGELGDLDQAKEARQWSDRLGVNPAAMARNRWRIASDEVGARRSGQRGAAPVAAVQSARSRLRAAAGGGA